MTKAPGFELIEIFLVVSVVYFVTFDKIEFASRDRMYKILNS